jgi:hypothetical protein
MRGCCCGGLLWRSGLGGREGKGKARVAAVAVACCGAMRGRMEEAAACCGAALLAQEAGAFVGQCRRVQGGESFCCPVL